MFILIGWPNYSTWKKKKKDLEGKKVVKSWDLARMWVLPILFNETLEKFCIFKNIIIWKCKIKKSSRDGPVFSENRSQNLLPFLFSKGHGCSKEYLTWWLWSGSWDLEENHPGLVQLWGGDHSITPHSPDTGVFFSFLVLCTNKGNRIYCKSEIQKTLSLLPITSTPAF